MRLVTRLALGLAVTLGVAGITRAGGGPDLDPIHAAVEVCGTSDSVASGMEPALVAFAGFADCKALCGKAEGVCKKLQKDNSGCYFDVIKNQELWSKRDCKAVYSAPADVKQCRQGAKDFYGPVLDGYRNDLKSALDQCRAWGDTCRDTGELG